MSAQIFIQGHQHIWRSPMDAAIVPVFTAKQQIEGDPIYLSAQANVRFQGKIEAATPGVTAVAGSFGIEATEGNNPFASKKLPVAEFLPVDLGAGCGVHGLTGGVSFANGDLTINAPDVDATPATFMFNIALPFRYFRFVFNPSNANANALLSVIVGARP